MRFRAKLVDGGCIQHFTKVVNTIAKLAKVCVLRITGDKLYFILSEQVTNGGVSIWCELAQGHFFNEYNMDGLSTEANEIFLEVIPDNFVKALKSAQISKSIKIKLTKKHAPCLTYEMELPSLTSHSRMVTHDVPVHVLPKRLWADFEEPEMPKFDVSIYMPPLKVLRNVVDRMKTMSNYIIISANQNGEFTIKVETDLVTITTHFKDLKNPVFGKQGSKPEQDTSQRRKLLADEFADARVDIRKFAQFLAGQQVNPNKVICNIMDNKVAHFFLLHDDVSLQYFMPAVAI